MNKTIATAAIAGSIILSPVASIGITPVREALLGLAPEDQIVALADEIDKSRVENEQKQTENEQKLAALEQELSAAKQTIAEQKTALETQKADQIAKDAAQSEQLKQEIEPRLLSDKKPTEEEKEKNKKVEDNLKKVRSGMDDFYSKNNVQFP
jgi:DNA repair exonuclease SbcCD ATPase subunit